MLVAFAISACGSQRVATPPLTITEPQVANPQDVALRKLPPGVRRTVESAIRSSRHSTKYSKVNAIEVYGPGSRQALNAAMGGGWVATTPTQRRARYYLTVAYGHFVCIWCSYPAGVSPPRGAISWSSSGGDGGIMQKLPRAVSRLHRLIRIDLR